MYVLHVRHVKLRQKLLLLQAKQTNFFTQNCEEYTVAMNELLCLKNAGAQISLFFTSYQGVYREETR